MIWKMKVSHLVLNNIKMLIMQIHIKQCFKICHIWEKVIQKSHLKFHQCTPEVDQRTPVKNEDPTVLLLTAESLLQCIPRGQEVNHWCTFLNTLTITSFFALFILCFCYYITNSESRLEVFYNKKEGKYFIIHVHLLGHFHKNLLDYHSSIFLTNIEING